MRIPVKNVSFAQNPSSWTTAASSGPSLEADARCLVLPVCREAVLRSSREKRDPDQKSNVQKDKMTSHAPVEIASDKLDQQGEVFVETGWKARQPESPKESCLSALGQAGQIFDLQTVVSCYLKGLCAIILELPHSSTVGMHTNREVPYVGPGSEKLEISFKALRDTQQIILYPSEG
ncbi:hypothetical protein STEG23_001226 [Scotinomys teguina]